MTIQGDRRVLTTGHFKNMPKIVCLCGSTRFSEAFQQANLEETLKGNIVLSVGCMTHSDKDLKISEEQKIALDELHKRKIDLADEILVLNVGGYIGKSTRSEIQYAETLRMLIRYLEDVRGEDMNPDLDQVLFTAKTEKNLKDHWLRIFNCDLDKLDKLPIAIAPNWQFFMVKCWDIFNCLPVRTYQISMNLVKGEYFVSW